MSRQYRLNIQYIQEDENRIEQLGPYESFRGTKKNLSHFFDLALKAGVDVVLYVSLYNTKNERVRWASTVWDNDTYRVVLREDNP